MSDQVRQWRVPVAQTVIKGALVVVLGAIAFLGAEDPAQVFLAGVAALGAAIVALRDIVAPVRLAADADGVTVISGYAGRVRIPWPQVAAIRVDEAVRYGLRIRMLEIETDDGDIHLLSRYDLGEDMQDARAELARLHVRAQG